MAGGELEAAVSLFLDMNTNSSVHPPRPPPNNIYQPLSSSSSHYFDDEQPSYLDNSMHEENAPKSFSDMDSMISDRLDKMTLRDHSFKGVAEETLGASDFDEDAALAAALAASEAEAREGGEENLGNIDGEGVRKPDAVKRMNLLGADRLSVAFCFLSSSFLLHLDSTTQCSK